MSIEFINVSKKLGNNIVINNVNIEIKKGIVTGLKGINGSGKTMMMRLIAGLIYATKGEVIIDGKVYTLSGYEEEDYLQKVATYINGKINEFQSVESFKRLPQDTKSTLIELNIADDYFKLLLLNLFLRLEIVISDIQFNQC